jgi:hypothetical protein
MKAKQALLFEHRMTFMPCTVDPDNSVATRVLCPMSAESVTSSSGVQQKLVDSPHPKHSSAPNPAMPKVLETHSNHVPVDGVAAADVYNATSHTWMDLHCAVGAPGKL